MTEPHDPIRDLVQRAHGQDPDRAEFDPHAGLADLRRRRPLEHNPAPRREYQGGGPYPAAHHRTIMAVDVAGYNHPSRTTAHLREVHEGLWRVLRATFAETGIPWDACFVENTGDGAMILLPPEITKADLVAEFPDRLHAELRRYNGVHAAEAQVRLRLALHAGEVAHGIHGSVSRAVSATFRMLDAPEVKAAQKESKADLALVASDLIYREVVIHEPAAGSASYRRIPVKAKPGQDDTWAWLRLVGAPSTVPATAPTAERADRPVAFTALVEAMLAISCVRNTESRRVLLERFPRREIADAVPYQEEDRQHVIELARTCERYDGGLEELLATVRTLDPGSPQVEKLGAVIANRRAYRVR